MLDQGSFCLAGASGIFLSASLYAFSSFFFFCCSAAICSSLFCPSLPPPPPLPRPIWAWAGTVSTAIITAIVKALISTTHTRKHLKANVEITTNPRSERASPTLPRWHFADHFDGSAGGGAPTSPGGELEHTPVPVGPYGRRDGSRKRPESGDSFIVMGTWVIARRSVSIISWPNCCANFPGYCSS